MSICSLARTGCRESHTPPSSPYHSFEGVICVASAEIQIWFRNGHHSYVATVEGRESRSEFVSLVPEEDSVEVLEVILKSICYLLIPISSHRRDFPSLGVPPLLPCLLRPPLISQLTSELCLRCLPRCPTAPSVMGMNSILLKRSL